MYYMLLEICSGGRFSEDSLYYYCRQIISAVANKSVIPYNVIKTTPKNITFSTVITNVIPNQIKKYKKEAIIYNKRFCSTQI